MKTAEEIRGILNESFSGDRSAFRPCAFFDERLDCIRVIARDCSVTETRLNTLITVLEANHIGPGKRECVGFTIKGASHFCESHGLDLAMPIKISNLLDAVLRAMPNIVVEHFVDSMARPLVAEGKIERVEIGSLGAPSSRTI